MNEYTMLVPVRFNDGTKVPKDQFRTFERRLVASFNGYTDLGKVKGAWKNDDGIMFNDVSRRYAVAAESIDKVSAMATMVAQEWQQEAIYVAQTSGRVEFVERGSLVMGARTTQSDLYAALGVLQRMTGTAERESPYLSLSHSDAGWKVVEIDTRNMGERDVFGARRRPAREMLSTMHFAVEAIEYARTNREES